MKLREGRTGGKLDFYCSRKIMQMCRRQRQLTLATLAMLAALA